MVEGIGIVNLWQPRTRNVKLQIAQLLRRVAIIDARDARYEVILRRAKRFDLEASRAVLRFQWAITCDCRRILRERPQLNLAADAVRGTDAGDTDSVGHDEVRRALARRRSRFGIGRLLCLWLFRRL